MSAGASLGGDVARAIDISALETPCFVTDLGALEANLKILGEIQNRARCTILLALKGFAQWSTFPLVRRYLGGATASSVAEVSRIAMSMPLCITSRTLATSTPAPSAIASPGSR